MKTPIPNLEFIHRHELAAQDAAQRREKLWTHERSRHESHTYPEPEKPVTPATPEWDDLL